MRGKPVLVPGRVVLSLAGHPSAQLQADINAGTLTAVDLVKTSVAGKAWDTQGYVDEKHVTVSLNVKGFKQNNKSKFKILQEVGLKGSQNKVEELRVKFKTATGLNRTVVLDPATQTTVDQTYIRKEVLTDFAKPLGSAYELINAEIAKKMFNML